MSQARLRAEDKFQRALIKLQAAMARNSYESRVLDMATINQCDLSVEERARQLEAGIHKLIDERTERFANCRQGQKVKKMVIKWFNVVFPAVKTTLFVATVYLLSCRLIFRAPFLVHLGS